jgi:hypothetical protein
MSTVLRRRRISRLALGPYRRFELLCGRIAYPVQNYDGYGDGRNINLSVFISAAMRADWQTNREMLMQIWSGELSSESFPDCLPWLCLGLHAGREPWAVLHLDI